MFSLWKSLKNKTNKQKNAELKKMLVLLPSGVQWGDGRTHSSECRWGKKACICGVEPGSFGERKRGNGRCHAFWGPNKRSHCISRSKQDGHTDGTRSIFSHPLWPASALHSIPVALEIQNPKGITATSESNTSRCIEGGN